MQTPDAVRKAAGALTLGLAIFLGLVVVATVLSWFGWVQL
jgi:phycobilisome rod-core linker protein